MNLADYMDQHPISDEDAERMKRSASARAKDVQAYQSGLDCMEDALRMKDACMDSLEQGAPPEFILLQAMKCIGALSGDQAYGDEAAAILRSVYPDIEQQTLFTISAQEQRRKLDELLVKYMNKEEKRLDSVIRQLGLVTNEAMKYRNELQKLEDSRMQ